LVIEVLISADSNRGKPFIDCIKKICSNSRGAYEWHFLPDEVADLRGRRSLEKKCLNT